MCRRRQWLYCSFFVKARMGSPRRSGIITFSDSARSGKAFFFSAGIMGAAEAPETERRAIHGSRHRAPAPFARLSCCRKQGMATEEAAGAYIRTTRSHLLGRSLDLDPAPDIQQRNPSLPVRLLVSAGPTSGSSGRSMIQNTSACATPLPFLGERQPHANA